MERDLNDYLRTVAEADERSLDGVSPVGPLERAARGVRRRRLLRHTRVAVLSVAGLAAVGGAALLAGPALQHPVDPATRGAVVTTHPTPSGDQIETPGIPPYAELTPDVLAQTGAGWVLSVHLAETYDPSGVRDDGGDTVLLTSPDGFTYRVPGVLAGSQLRVVDWRAGATTAVVREFVDGHSHRAVLDLADGTVTPDERGLPDDATFVGRSTQGELWHGGVFVLLADDGTSRSVYDGPSEGLGQLDPTGRRMIGSRDVMTTGDHTTFEVVDLETGDVTGPFSLTVDGLRCGIETWLDPVNLLARCVEPGASYQDGFEELELDVSGAQLAYRSVRTVGADDDFIVGAQWLSDRTLVGDTVTLDEQQCASTGTSLRHRDGSLENIHVLEPGAFGATVPKVAAGIVYVQSEQGCNGEQAPSTLTAHDLAGHINTLLLGFPVDNRGDRPGMLSWVVAQ